MSYTKDGLTFDSPKAARDWFKMYPTQTRAWKKALIKALSKTMMESFLKKADKIPAHWDGVEIRTWMAEEWQREGYARLLKGKRGKQFRADKYTHSL